MVVDRSGSDTSELGEANELSNSSEQNENLDPQACALRQFRNTAHAMNHSSTRQFYSSGLQRALAGIGLRRWYHPHPLDRGALQRLWLRE